MNTAAPPKPATHAVIDLRDAWRTQPAAPKPLDEPLDFCVPEDLAERIRSHIHDRKHSGADTTSTITNPQEHIK